MQEESRTTRFRRLMQEMKAQRENQSKGEETKRVCVKEKPFTGMKKENKGEERE